MLEKACYNWEVLTHITPTGSNLLLTNRRVSNLDLCLKLINNEQRLVSKATYLYFFPYWVHRRWRKITINDFYYANASVLSFGKEMTISDSMFYCHAYALNFRSKKGDILKPIWNSILFYNYFTFSHYFIDIFAVLVHFIKHFVFISWLIVRRFILMNKNIKNYYLSIFYNNHLPILFYGPNIVLLNEVFH